MDFREVPNYMVDAAKRYMVPTILAVGLIASAACSAEEASGPSTTETHAPEVTTSPGSEAAPTPAPTIAEKSVEPHAEKAPLHPKFAASDNDALRALAPLEKEAGEGFNFAMQFFAIDANQVSGGPDAWQAAALKQQAEAGIKPLLIIEPDPDLIDMQKIASGDKAEVNKVTKYFKALQKSGISSEQLGLVVLDPEHLVGGWRNATPENYAACFKTFAAELHKVFPAAHIANMVDMGKLEADPLAGTFGQLPLSEMSYFGFQAFQNDTKINFDANGNPTNITDYFNADKMATISKSLPVKMPIWINTGFPHEKYTPKQRLAIAKAVSAQIKKMRDLGVDVALINIFGDDYADEGLHDFSIKTGDRELLVTMMETARGVGAERSAFAASSRPSN